MSHPRVVDARGHRCPVPTLRLRRALARVEPAETVLLIADDPLARIDAPRFAAAAGHALVFLEAREGALHILVRRGPAPLAC